VGATGMTSGAADLLPWISGGRLEPSTEAREFLEALGVFGPAGYVATSEGVIRPAQAVGARVLNLQSHAGKRIALAHWERDDYRPRSLAVQLADSDWARTTRTRIEVIDVPGVVEPDHLRYPLAAFCRLFDDDERLRKLTQAATRLAPEMSALLLGPWLGAAKEPLPASGVSIGETLSPPDGAFGRRVERAFQDWLTHAEIEMREVYVKEIRREATRVRVEAVHPLSREASTIWADGIVVATGGLIGHGVDLWSEPGRPLEMRALLGSPAAVIGGARDGFDGSYDGGRWVFPPHYQGAPAESDQLRYAGDVRGEADKTAPGGTLLGAVESGIQAARALV